MSQWRPDLFRLESSLKWILNGAFKASESIHAMNMACLTPPFCIGLSNHIQLGEHVLPYFHPVPGSILFHLWVDLFSENSLKSFIKIHIALQTNKNVAARKSEMASFFLLTFYSCLEQVCCCVVKISTCKQLYKCIAQLLMYTGMQIVHLLSIICKQPYCVMSCTCNWEVRSLLCVHPDQAGNRVTSPWHNPSH